MVTCVSVYWSLWNCTERNHTIKGKLWLSLGVNNKRGLKTIWGTSFHNSLFLYCVQSCISSSGFDLCDRIGLHPVKHFIFLCIDMRMVMILSKSSNMYTNMLHNVIHFFYRVEQFWSERKCCDVFCSWLWHNSEYLSFCLLLPSNKPRCPGQMFGGNR